MTLAPHSAAVGPSTSVAKALGLLDAFRNQSSTVSLANLAAGAGLPKSTAHRLLGVLEGEGFVQRHASGYSLGRQVFELGNLIPDARPRSLRSVSMPFLSELYEATHQTVHLAVLDGAEVLYLDKVYGHKSLDTPTWVGARLPATCTALGKAILAHSEPETVESVLAAGIARMTPHSLGGRGVVLSALERIRSDGLASDNEESRIGLSCLAAPLINRATGRAFAAISVAGPPAARDRVREPLRRVAHSLGDTLSMPVNSAIRRNATR